MFVIGILNTKGGVGKSTIAANLSVRASKERFKHVGVVDLDAQKSIVEWHGMRDDPENPELFTGADLASEAIYAISQNQLFDYLFLDGPPGAVPVTRDAVRESNLVIIPMRASAVDLTPSWACIEVCQQYKTPYLVVFNHRMTGDKKAVEDLRREFQEMGIPVAKASISSRNQHHTAMADGKVGADVDKTARAEFDALWGEVKTILNKGSKSTAKKKVVRKRRAQANG